MPESEEQPVVRGPATPSATTKDVSHIDDLRQDDDDLALLVLHSPDRSLVGRCFPIARRLSVGRRSGRDVDLVVADPRISRRHATFGPDARTRTYVVVDHASRNQTRVNGQPQTRSSLFHGDIVRIGDTLFEVTPPLDEPIGPASPLIGRAPSFCRALQSVVRYAGSEHPILLLGESGTGKELAARWIHDLSRRRGPFVSVNCAAIPAQLVESSFFGHRKGAFTGASTDAEGHFRAAKGGTLLLDEVGELRLDHQPRFLRVIETGEFTPVGSTRAERSDARIVAATNADLRASLDAGTFRRDLYARLAIGIVRLPPLRKRRSDIPALARHFLKREAESQPVEWTAGFLEALLLYDWPMNVRELKSVMYRLALLGGNATLTTSHLREVMNDAAPIDGRPSEAAVDSPEAHTAPTREELAAQVEECRGNITQVAIRFGKAPAQIYRWLRKHRLDPNDFRR